MGHCCDPGVDRLAGEDASQFTLTVPARPDKTLTIRKWTLLPGVDAATRTLQLRLEVDNADEALKPGMNAWLQLNTASEPMLLIPSQALIDTGSEQRVITVDADGALYRNALLFSRHRKASPHYALVWRKVKGGFQRPVPDRFRSQYFWRTGADAL